VVIQLKFIVLHAVKRKSNHARLICWGAVILFLALIFLLSNQGGIMSNKLSNRIADLITPYMRHLPVLNNFIGDVGINYNTIVRKAGHVLEFFILALLVYRAVRRYKISAGACAGITLLICLAFAGLDELHQTLIPTRTPLVEDVLIDAAGAGIGTAIMYAAGKIKRIAGGFT
jgi:VanZ family protein